MIKRWIIVIFSLYDFIKGFHKRLPVIVIQVAIILFHGNIILLYREND